MFSFPMYYVTVWFQNGQRAYTYKTQDKTITINTVVMVPVGDRGELKPAIVSGVSREPPAGFPKEKIKSVYGRAGLRDQALFKGIDTRMPLDISSRAMKVNGEIVSVATSKEERDKLRRQFANDPRVKLVERYPESKMKAPQTMPTAKTKTKKKDDLSWIDRTEEMDAFLDD